MNPLFRPALERISRGRVLKRHLPQEFGRCPLLVSPDASLRFWKPWIESDLFDFAKEFVLPGHVVWDIGANVGLFSVAAACRAGKSGQVIAVEADIWLAELLQQSVALQPTTSAPIEIIPAAASDSIALKSFYIARRGRAANFLSGMTGSTQTGGIRETHHVVTITLDWLMKQGSVPDVVKIDVEGAEFDVLRGGLHMIAQASPVILCEVSDYADEVSELSR